ncbi:beta-1,6-N-acetylglucosaminyltransferase [Thalassotalea agariperforans]
MRKKIAFLCLAHNNFAYLAKVSQYYCSQDDGFFVHIDKSVNLEAVSELSEFSTNSVILNDDERVRTAWGSFNIVLATMALINKALASDNYDRFVLVSGADLPLLTKEQLKTRLAQNLNYFGVWETVCTEQPSPFSHEFFTRHYYDHKLTNPGLAYGTGSRVHIYRMLLLNRLLAYLPLSKKRFTYPSYAKGSQWWCITREMAQYFCDVFSQQHLIEQFTLMHAPDEKIFHTLANHSPYQSTLNIDHGQCSLKQGLHYIDWGYQNERIALQTFDIVNADKAKQLGCAFARKLPNGVSPELSTHLDNLLSEV